jgi:hypothetical protein
LVLKERPRRKIDVCGNRARGHRADRSEDCRYVMYGEPWLRFGFDRGRVSSLTLSRGTHPYHVTSFELAASVGIDDLLNNQVNTRILCESVQIGGISSLLGMGSLAEAGRTTEQKKHTRANTTASIKFRVTHQFLITRTSAISLWQKGKSSVDALREKRGERALGYWKYKSNNRSSVHPLPGRSDRT